MENSEMTYPLFATILGFGALFLHEFGHWLMLKRYKIPHHIFFDWKRLLIEFKTKPQNPKQGIKITLAGAFPPLLVLIPCFFSVDEQIIIIGFTYCLFFAIWTCIELWYNISRLVQ